MAIQNFAFHNPVKIYFGNGQLDQLEHEVPQDARVMLISGAASARHSGLLDTLEKILGGRVVTSFGDVCPNPDYQHLIKAREQVRQYEVDFLLGVGGGSVIDGTKFIAAACCWKGDCWEMVHNNLLIHTALPFGCIPTLPAAGSEMNCYAVINHNRLGQKRSFDSPKLFPQFSILDPKLTLTLPQSQTANGIADSFTHVLEQYLTYPVDAPVQDRLSESLLHTIIEQAPLVLGENDNYAIRANLMWCSTLAINDLISAGVPSDWTTHEIGHFLTAIYGIDHARTLAILMPSVLQYRRHSKHKKLLQYADRVWNLRCADTGENETDLINRVIERTRGFYQSLGILTSLSDYGVSGSDLPKLLSEIESAQITPLGEHQDIGLIDIEKILWASL